MDAILNKDCSFFRAFVIISLSAAVSACGTLTGIPSHGGGKRFVIEQRLVSTTIRGAIKQIDLTALRGKTVFLQITSINDQGAGNLVGGRASAIFALQGISESRPVTTVRNNFRVFDLSNSSRSTTNSSSSSNASSLTLGNSTANGSIIASGSGTSDSIITTEQTGSGTNDSVTTVDTTNATTTNNTNDTTTTTGDVVTTQTGNPSSTSTTENTGTTTFDGESTNTSSGTTTNDTDTTTNNRTDSLNQNTNSSATNSSNSQSSSAQTLNSGTSQTLAQTDSETRTKGSGYQLNYGVNYEGQGTYQNFNVPVSDVGILQSIIRTYFYLNDVTVALDPKNPNIEGLVNINIDVFGSLRSRLDTVVYNKEMVMVQTELEVMAIDTKTKNLMLIPQVGSYEATYNEKYVFWIGPFNQKKSRIKHKKVEDSMLVSFDDEAKAKFARDQAKSINTPPAAGAISQPSAVQPAISSPTPSTKKPNDLLSREQRALPEIRDTLLGWLRSQEQSDVNQYISYYSPSFKPESGFTREKWQESVSKRIVSEQNVKIAVKEVDVSFTAEQTKANIDFLQDYQSATGSSQTKKFLLLEKIAGQWKIISEK